MILETTAGIKTTAGIITISTIFAFFAPIAPLLLTIAIFVVADLVTAIMRDIKKVKNEEYCKELSGWKKFCCKVKIIKSNKIKRTGLKAFAYMAMVGLTYLLEIQLFGMSIYIHNLVVAAPLLIAELVSICENFDYTLGGNVFTNIVKKVRKAFEDALIKKIENPKIEGEK